MRRWPEIFAAFRPAGPPSGKGTHLMPEVGLPAGFVPPSAALSPAGERERASAPHCDSSILHAPSSCEHCDHYPDWQEFRDAQQINYTGEHDESKAPCPSEHFRPAEVRDRWPGNRPSPA